MNQCYNSLASEINVTKCKTIHLIFNRIMFTFSYKLSAELYLYTDVSIFLSTRIEFNPEWMDYEFLYFKNLV